MATVKSLPTRNEVSAEDTWDLASLYTDDDQWEADFLTLDKRIAGYQAFRGKLSESAERLAECLEFDLALDRLLERLGVYAFLKTTEDQTNSTYQRMQGRFQNAAVKASQAASFLRPEILAIPPAMMDQFLQAPCLEPHRLSLERVLRYRPYTLSQAEENLLAMQGEMAQAANQAFSQLLDSDLKFGTVQNEQGEQIELTNSTFMQLLVSPERSVRQTAFHQYYQQFSAHENTLAATLSGSIQKDIYYARARGYGSALEMALFADDVPPSVYDNLISSVKQNLPALARYYDLRRRAMGLDEIHHYDTYVPILSELRVERSWEQAVEVIMEALQPLGSSYCQVLERGLRGRWCDRYPNRGKRSGAFSCGSFDGDPYILMNFKPEVFDDVFTLAHEAGHSMHSYYSAGAQPFQYYNYVIFVAEVASTFNEQLLSQHLMQRADDPKERAYLINRELDGIRATIIRQTMFAEFEKVTHEMAEQGEPLTVDAFKSIYRGLLETYFGPDFTLDPELALEGLRIPHFYRAFYVYKYATGLSAAIALSERVLQGGPAELEAYLTFLKSGCTKYPLELLRDAGVDMEQPAPVDAALQRFGKLVTELEELLEL